ncbi:heterodisulfide reductase-related iron-sulfur binding cluster [Immundisolibacter sp.]
MATSESRTPPREGNLEAPTRHVIEWQTAEYYDPQALETELERVFDICHGCRRCVSLCQAFPTLFDLVDESSTMEVDGVAKSDYMKVVDQCYLCDLCYMTKCPYVPPHEWNVDFPHLMLRAKAVKFKTKGASFRDRFLTSTDLTGKLAGIPLVTETVNAVNRNKPARQVMEKTIGIHADAVLPPFAIKPLKRHFKDQAAVNAPLTPQAGASTTGKVLLFGTCYGHNQMPELGNDLAAIYRHNGLPVTLADDSRCCGMPKLELGDLDSVNELKKHNLPALAAYVDQGYDIVAPVPSCVLMFKQELRLMFPGDADVQKVAARIFDPFEYLIARHKDGLLKTDFKQALGKIAYHPPCHLRVQNIGLKTREVFQLIPGTEVVAIERCAGHDGTYGVKVETHPLSMKIGTPVFNRVREIDPVHYASDCPIACKHIESGVGNGKPSEHPLQLLRLAYGI